MRQGGFTLVETMVALLVFGLVASAGALMLGNSVEASQQIEEASAETMALQRSRAALAADLAQIAPRPSRDADGGLRPLFAAGRVADGALFSFIRLGPDNPDGEARPELQYVAWHQGETGLERRSARYLDGAAEEVSATLLPGAAGARAEFYYEGAWSGDIMTGPDAEPPRAVRLTLDHPGFGRVEQLFLVGAGE
ncbi:MULTISPECIES: type II secretion system minor pseudopilin GspJ [Pacificimonas]|uniref:Type II secretion system protein J n=1 Tax=Pacificimonas aurantium TaxID=1250540 RepID=A0ABS7WN07_9SPHN|nr:MULTISPECIES: type II secretion system minor pseudopilin GspJ [Pacificimonas]MBZ6379797.1 type II secretion system minor pseudopilin GspJ [Pacificimonas aurantium]